MSNDFHVELALDVSKHFYNEKKEFLLTRLPNIGDIQFILKAFENSCNPLSSSYTGCYHSVTLLSFFHLFN